MKHPNYINSERIILVDALRGLALMGLFLVHMVEYFELFWYNPEKNIFNEITFFFFGGKAYAVFSLLFGFSFFIIMDNQNKRGIDFRIRFLWRLFILLIFGILHGLLYGGDILIILALTGFALIPFYKTKNIFLAIIALFFLLQIPAILFSIFNLVYAQSEPPLHWALFDEILKVYAHGNIFELLSTTVWNAQIAKWTFMFESGRLSTIFGMSLMGLLLGKIKFFKEYQLFKTKNVVFFFSSLLLSIIFISQREIFNSIFNAENNWVKAAILNSYSDLFFTVTGILLFILLFQFELQKKYMSYLAYCGRMSLTIYISQSIIFVPFFYGFGFGAYSFIGQTASFLIGIIFWILQMLIANLWLKYFYFGPLEWLWRSITYFRSDIKFKRKNEKIVLGEVKTA